MDIDLDLIRAKWERRLSGRAFCRDAEVLPEPCHGRFRVSFSTSEPMPDRVVVAERRRDGPDAVGRTYNYRIVSFDNLAGP